MFKRKDGRWCHAVIINGKRTYFYGNTKNELMRKVFLAEEGEETGKPFSKVAYEWYESIEDSIEISTQKSYKRLMNKAADYFSNVKIKEITAKDVKKHLDLLGETLSDKSLIEQLNIYRLIFRYAVNHGYVDVNPAAEIRIKNKTQVKRKPPKDDAIEIVKQSKDCQNKLLFITAMCTGLRRGELMALTWRDIDFQKRTIAVTKSVTWDNNTPVLKKPKTETSYGSVPIPDTLYEELIKHKKKSGLVFPNKYGEFFRNSEQTRDFTKWEDGLGIHVTLHQLRHYYATVVCEAEGMTPQDAQILLRHAQFSTTMDIYREIRDRQKERTFSKINDVNF